MDRLDVELYAERLARHAQRAADDLADARLRAAWLELEREVRDGLVAADCARLEAIGLFLPPASAPAVTRALQERAGDLAAIHRLQALVERRRVAVRQSESGAIATSRPPSSS